MNPAPSRIGANACLALAALLLLSSCVTQPTAPPLSSGQLIRLKQLDQWSLSGRLALSDGDQGGSGRLNWEQQPQSTELRFHAAFGQGSWRLKVTPRLAQLELGDDQIYTAPQLDRLLVETVGWQLPVEALVWWVRGLPAPSAPYEADQGESDRLERLQQFGWTVQYTAFIDVDGLSLPRKMTATRGSDRVKLVIKRWQLPPTAKS